VEYLRPDRFRESVAAALADRAQRAALERATGLALHKREKIRGETPEWESLRERAYRIKEESLRRLPELLRAFEEQATAAGAVVHWARHGSEAVEIVQEVAQAAGVRRVVKAKSMATEEIGLREAMIAAGCDVVETDLGEFIVQLAGQPPSHLTAPALHLSRREIGRIFERELGTPYSEDPVELTMIARRVLRERFLAAEMGITGANFALAESGAIVLFENEGNIRLTVATPRVIVSVVGIEKVIPGVGDLPVFLRLLPPSATGQKAPAYITILRGPRGGGSLEGVQEWHIVLLDNGRSRIYGRPEYRQALRCIRCGACLNVCPVYQQIGGHAYGSVYPGPIGAVLTPLLGDLGRARWLPQASSLCGACSEICPVKIEIHEMLLRLRAELVSAGYTSRLERSMVRLAPGLNRAGTFRLAGRLARLTRRGPGRRLRRLLLAPWEGSRELPPVPRATFRELWPRLSAELSRDDGGEEES
jgi:L-lactate dehydrogenase complex protein LldF